MSEYPRQKVRQKTKAVRSGAHLARIRKMVCSVGHCPNLTLIEAAHVRNGTDGGMGKKPSDCYVIPLCAEHHREQHRIGERSFSKKYGISMKLLAEKLWRDCE